MEKEYPVIDVHSHVLPGIDDGSRTMEESLKLLEMVKEQGVDAVFATPHCPRRGPVRPTEELLSELREKVHGRLGSFSIYSGHETFYHENLPAQLKGGEARTLAGGKFVLVEFRTDVPYSALYRGLRTLGSSGYIPVLAHMERYGCLRTEKNLEDLTGCGCWLQMNFDSIQGNWLNPDVRWCRKQILKGRIRLMGTDMHRLDFRPPNIRQAMKWMEGHVEPVMLKRILCDNPGRIIDNKN